MIPWLKKYWPEVLTFGVVFGAILWATAPALTWMMVDSDGPEYVMAAKYFYPAHHTSAPFYLLAGHLFLRLPFGTDYWKMSLMSGVFTLGTMVFLYLIVRRLIQGSPSGITMSMEANQRRARFYGLLAAVIYGGSMLIFAQSIIVETYAVVSFFSVAAYYFSLKKQWYLVATMLGFGLVTHHLILLTWLVMFIAHKELRHWKTFGLTAGFLVFYLYMPLSVRFTDQPNMWGNTSIRDFFTNNIGVFTMLVGQLSIYDFPKRVLDVLGVLGVSFGLAVIPLAWWIWKYKKLRNELLWLFLLPIFYVSSDLAYQIFKYMAATIAWGSIMAVIALNQIDKKWLVYGVGGVAVVLLGVNTQYMDIGRTLDKNLSAQTFYDVQLPKMNDGDIFVTNGAWEWIEVFLYNKETGHSIIPVCMGILPSDRYRNMLRDQGVKIDELPLGSEGTRSHNLNEQQVFYSLSITENNPNVWTSRPTHPETYGAELVPAKTNEGQFTKWLGHDIITPVVQWKPDNPWYTVTGALEVKRWIFILQSNRTVIWLATLLGLGYTAAWASLTMWKRRKKKAISEVKADD